MDIKRILVPIDIAYSSELLAEYARTVAEKFGAELIVMYVARDVEDLGSLQIPHISIEKIEEEVINAAHKKLTSFCETYFAGNVKYEVVIRTGNAYREISAIIPELNIDLVIMGAHSTEGIDRFFFGSTAERVLRGAICPVLTVKLI
ncbi:MAG: universal stress protein [Deltaproteobacteria bacterium]|nr:universal stress protein [Candidatus Zymogenaceae bacterium]